MEKYHLLFLAISGVIFCFLFFKLYRWSNKDKKLLFVFFIMMSLLIGGLSSNALVIAANNGKMPVDVSECDHYNDGRYYKQILAPEAGDKKYILASRDTRLNFLDFNSPKGIVGLASIGDVLLGESTFWFVYIFNFCVIWIFFIKPLMLKLS
jgi:hypothetical protein